jgi:hypothetical protein
MKLTVRHERPGRKLVEYDPIRRRLWILGQRCHHGATGSLVAAAACLGIVADLGRPPLIAAAVTAGALMAHDWSDRAIWFERGRGTQA